MTSVLILFLGLGLAQEWSVPKETKQMVMGVATNWNSSVVALHRYSRQEDGEWVLVGDSIEARIGKKGLAWGRGLHPPQHSGLQKTEGDWRAPVGVFYLQSAYGYAPSAPSGVSWNYEQVTERDLWVEDPQSSLYNQHIELPIGQKATEWEKSQQMKLEDEAHRLKIAVSHNAEPNIVSGAGSAIFIHIWRDRGNRPTAGCTAMSHEDILEVLRWLEPSAKPVFVLVPHSVYVEKGTGWGLP